MTDRPMMTCGHTAQGHTLPNDDTAPAPVCVICSCTEVDAAYTGPAPERMMRCSYAKRSGDTHTGGGQYAGKSFPSLIPSNPQGAFFSSKPDAAEDEFYCGCWGWN